MSNEFATQNYVDIKLGGMGIAGGNAFATKEWITGNYNNAIIDGSYSAAEFVREADISKDDLILQYSGIVNGPYIFSNKSVTIGKGHYLIAEMTYEWITLSYGSNFALSLEAIGASCSMNDNIKDNYTAFAQNWGEKMILRTNNFSTSANSLITFKLIIDENGNATYSRTGASTKTGVSWREPFNDLILPQIKLCCIGSSLNVHNLTIRNK